MTVEQAMVAVIWQHGTPAQQRRAALYRQHTTPTTSAALAALYRKVVSS